MPARSIRNLPHLAILWRKTEDDFQGEPVVDGPEEIRCRWEDRKGQAVNPDGTVIGLDAQVQVREEVAIDSLMVFGPIIQLVGTGTIFDDPASAVIMQVKTQKNITDIKGRMDIIWLGLVRFRGSLPASVG